MADAKPYSGGCHCGNVRFEVTADVGNTVSCNCSICQKRGSVLTFVGAPEFNLVSGEDCLTDYQFNKKVIHHLFCKTCGVASFARGKTPGGREMVAVNVRCLDGIDMDTITPTQFDGRSA